MDEQKLIEKLRRIEALVSGGATPGERSAAEAARTRIQERLRELERESPPEEFRFTLGNLWSRRLFVALARRYELTPYRYKRQRRTTVMLRVSKRFCDEILWPEFIRLDTLLESYLDEVADRVIGQAIHADCSEAETRLDSPKNLTLSAGPTR